LLAGRQEPVSIAPITFNFRQAGNLSGAAPYARIFLDSDNDGATDTDVILDPSKGGAVTPIQNTDLTFGTGDDSVRYGDDAGAVPQQSWASVKSAGNYNMLMVAKYKTKSTGKIHTIRSIRSLSISR
jgi:hypothetical protein